MNAPGFSLFETAIGSCAILWRGDRIVGLRLPDTDEDALRDAIKRRHAQAAESSPPSFVANAVISVAALTHGESVRFDLRSLDLDPLDAFTRRVLSLTAEIPFGQTRRYGDLARALGDIAKSRAVGAALGANPFPVMIPCHRVIATDGSYGGFSAPRGVETKRRLLAIEGAFNADNLPLFAL